MHQRLLRDDSAHAGVASVTPRSVKAAASAPSGSRMALSASPASKIGMASGIAAMRCNSVSICVSSSGSFEAFCLASAPAISDSPAGLAVDCLGGPPRRRSWRIFSSPVAVTSAKLARDATRRLDVGDLFESLDQLLLRAVRSAQR